MKHVFLMLPHLMVSVYSDTLQQRCVSSHACMHASSFLQTVVALESSPDASAQLAASSRGAAARSLFPIPVARSYLTSDPEAAAAAYLAIFRDAVRVPQNLSAAEEPSCANITVLRLPTGVSFTFVQDGRKPNPAEEAIPVQTVLDSAAADMKRVKQGEVLWTQWEDNHDGYGLPLGADMSALVNETDVVTYIVSKTKKETQTFLKSSVTTRDDRYSVILRFWLPGGFSTVEVGIPTGKSVIIPGMEKTLASVAQDDPDFNRQVATDYDLLVSRHLNDFNFPWFKATTATSDPAAAKSFVMKYLGARSVTSPYINTGQPDSHYAEWVAFDNPNLAYEAGQPDPFMMHFVLSYPGKHFTSGGQVTTSALSEAIAQGRNLSANVFDTYMYNALTLWVLDLAPYIARFKADAVPYLLRGWPASGVAGVFVTLPGAVAGVIELRSDRGVDSATIAANPWDACSKS